MAVKNFTITKTRGRQFAIGLFHDNSTNAQKLMNDDTTTPLLLTGVYTVHAVATYIKGQSEGGQLLLVVDGVVVDTSGTPATTDGATLSIEWTGAVASSITLKAAITGANTSGANLSFARIGAYDATIK